MEKKYVKDLKPYLPPIYVKTDTPLKEIVKKILENPERNYLCVKDEDNSFKGLISKQRVFRAVFSHHVPPDSRLNQLFTLLTSESAEDLIITSIFKVYEDDELDEAIKILVEHHIFEIPVCDQNDHPIGFLDINQILKIWLENNHS